MRRYTCDMTLEQFEQHAHEHGGVYCYSEKDFDNISDDDDCVELLFEETKIMVYFVPYTMTTEGLTILDLVISNLEDI